MIFVFNCALRGPSRANDRCSADLPLLEMHFDWELIGERSYRRKKSQVGG